MKSILGALILALVMGFASNVHGQAWSTNQLTTSALSERQQRALFNQPQNSFVLPVSTGLPTTNIVDNAAGRQLQADKTAFPFLASLPNQGSAAFITVLKPCGMISVHSHPRATEQYVVISGTMTGAVAQETGVVNSSFTVSPGQSMVVPQGLWHLNLNNQCTPNVFIQVFNSADAGTVPLTGALAGFTAASADAAAAGNFATSPGTLGAFALSQTCLSRCGFPSTGAPGNGLSGLSPELQVFTGIASAPSTSPGAAPTTPGAATTTAAGPARAPSASSSG